MKVYEWSESEHFYIAQVRPSELFDLSTVQSLPDWEEWNNPDIDGPPIGTLWAINITTGKKEIFKYIYDKIVGRDYARGDMAQRKEYSLARDTRDLDRLTQPT